MNRFRFLLIGSLCFLCSVWSGCSRDKDESVRALQELEIFQRQVYHYCGVQKSDSSLNKIVAIHGDGLPKDDDAANEVESLAGRVDKMAETAPGLPKQEITDYVARSRALVDADDQSFLGRNADRKKALVDLARALSQADSIGNTWQAEEEYLKASRAIVTEVERLQEVFVGNAAVMYAASAAHETEKRDQALVKVNEFLSGFDWQGLKDKIGSLPSAPPTLEKAHSSLAKWAEQAKQLETLSAELKEGQVSDSAVKPIRTAVFGMTAEFNNFKSYYYPSRELHGMD